MAALPSWHEARQLLRLRALRVQQARDAVAKARVDVQHAQDVVDVRRRAIAATRGSMESLARRVVHGLAPHLPRWAGVAGAERARLADRLERDEVGLIEDEHALEEAHDRLQQSLAALTRALAAEDAVKGLADEARRERSRVVERLGEVELDDQSTAWRRRA